MYKYHKITSYEAEVNEVEKVVLLYSGGLDSSIMIKWLQEEYQAQVITLTVNLGQLNDNLETIRNKALSLGATQAIVVDAVEEFSKDYIFKGIKANGCYQGNYYLSTPLGRPLIVKHAVKTALETGANAIAHGCTGKGNDQIRFDAGIMTLCPGMKVIAPVREWSMGRTQEINYAKKHGIEVPVDKEHIYSHDDNIWGLTSEGGEIENPSLDAPLASALQITTLPALAPDQSEKIAVSFLAGEPVAINGQQLDPAALISQLNLLGGKHGVGTCILLEDRVLGMKVRGIYEAPAAEILINAHKDLEKLVCTKKEIQAKWDIDSKWSDMCYSAKWFHPLMKPLEAFINKVNEKVTGSVTLELYKGKATVLSCNSPNSLFNDNHATFENSEVYNSNCSAPFIELYSLEERLAGGQHE